MKATRYRAPVLLALLLVLFAARLIHTSFEKSFTNDEPHYLGTGLYLWQSGDYDWFETLLFQTPLAYHLASLPLLALELELDDFQPGRRAGHVYVENAEAPLTTLRLAMRLPFVLLSCWGAFLAFLWAREVAGERAGLLAAFLFTFSPTLLAYGPLAHSDITASVLYLQTLYCFWRWWRSPSSTRLALCGLSLGLALAAKASAVLLPAMFAGILALLWWRPEGQRLPELRGSVFVGVVRALGAMGLIGVAVVWAAYGGSFHTQPTRVGPFEALPVPSYLQSFFFTARVAQAQHPFWFFGQVVERPSWYFLPAGFLVKTPLPILLLGLAAALRRSARFRAARLGPFLGVPTLLFALVACFALKVPHGVRYLLPLHPLLFVFIATRLAGVHGRGARGVLLASCAWLAVVSLSVHPHYLSYFNASIGGSEHAHEYFADTNLDWGQDVGTLSRWLEERGNPKIRVALFSAQPPEAFGIRAWPLPGCREVNFGLVAISVAVFREIHGAPFPTARPPVGCYTWLRAHQPIASPGHSILVFDLGPRPAPRSKPADRS